MCLYKILSENLDLHSSRYSKIILLGDVNAGIDGQKKVFLRKLRFKKSHKQRPIHGRAGPPFHDQLVFF